MDAKRQQRAVTTAHEYRQGNIAVLDEAMTRRLVASTVFTESNGGDLAITNRQGYVGRYQAGAQWLADAGLVDRAKLEEAMAGEKTEWNWAVSGGMGRFLDDPANWKNGLSLERYKASADLQDQAFKRICDAAFERASKQGLLHEGDDPGRIAGFLKARHIAGYGGAVAVLRGKPARRDGNGTSNYDYFNDIARNRDGLDVLMDLPHKRPSLQSVSGAAHGVLPDGYADQPAPLSRRQEEGAHGGHVKRLQGVLNHLGYRDAQDRRLAVDGDFGRHTREAVERFQRDHGLRVDGIVGPKTEQALHRAEHPLLTDRRHPQRAFFMQARDRVQLMEGQRCVGAGPHTDRLAGVIAVDAMKHGLTRIDRVELNEDGSRVRAVQISAVGDIPGLNRTTAPVSTQHAIQQSLSISSEQIRQAAADRAHAHQPAPDRQQAVSNPVVQPPVRMMAP